MSINGIEIRALREKVVCLHKFRVQLINRNKKFTFYLIL